jgi:hypothetical protein
MNWPVTELRPRKLLNKLMQYSVVHVRGNKNTQRFYMGNVM